MIRTMVMFITLKIADTFKPIAVLEIKKKTGCPYFKSRATKLWIQLPGWILGCPLENPTRYFGTSIVTVVARFRRVMCDISLPVSEISLPLSKISFTLSEKSLSLSEISLSLNEKLLPFNELSLPLTEKLMNMVSYVSPVYSSRKLMRKNRLFLKLHIY